MLRWRSCGASATAHKMEKNALTDSRGCAPAGGKCALLLLLAAVAVPLSLLWDLSWESTVGVDSVWAAPHVVTYAAIALACFGALGQFGTGVGVRVGKLRAPLGAWIALWGAVAFGGALLFDRWWQAGYGLAAGIWHPPQLAKVVAFFAIAFGAWWTWARSAFGGACVLAMIAVVTLAENFPNRQHAALFHQIACGAYPLVLVALAVAGRSRFTATTAALAAMLLQAAMTWLLPLVAGSPLTGPIYNHRDHLWPPPFPLLIVVPALAFDLLLRVLPDRSQRKAGWAQAVELALTFFFVFVSVQWVFSKFLLSPAAEGWFFAGGGKEWPFFLRFAPGAQTQFWPVEDGEFNTQSALIAFALAILSARIGLALGAWMKRLQR